VTARSCKLADRLCLAQVRAETSDESQVCGETRSPVCGEVAGCSQTTEFTGCVAWLGCGDSVTRADSAATTPHDSSPSSATDASSTSGSDKLHSSTQPPSDSSFNDAEGTSSKPELSTPCQHTHTVRYTTVVPSEYPLITSKTMGDSVSRINAGFNTQFNPKDTVRLEFGV